jgi:hypothetical protein
VSSLVPLLQRGQELQSSTPDPTLEPQAIPEWLQKVGSWSSETEAFLAVVLQGHPSLSPTLSTLEGPDREVHRSDGSMFRVAGYFGDLDQVLQVKLNNLQRVMENPEAYF